MVWRKWFSSSKATPADTLRPVPRVEAFSTDAERHLALNKLSAALSLDTADAPTKMGRFEVRQKLGEGGMGIVFRCHDPRSGRDVAIKQLHRSKNHASPQRLAREAHALARVDHPNVVRVHEIGHDGETDYLVMELVHGRTLSAWIAEDKPDRSSILQALLSAGRGLEAVHACGLVHRDFKPENVMIEASGRVVVMDFGLVKGTVDRGELSSLDLGGKLTSTGVVVGTPAYMAPEQILGEGGSARSDQFNFCCTAWEAFYGSRPFTGDGVLDYARAVVKGKTRPVDSPMPAPVHEAVLRGLSPDPERRFPSMNELLAAFE